MVGIRWQSASLFVGHASPHDQSGPLQRTGYCTRPQPKEDERGRSSYAEPRIRHRMAAASLPDGRKTKKWQSGRVAASSAAWRWFAWDAVQPSPRPTALTLPPRTWCLLSHNLVVHSPPGCGRNSVAACSRRVRTAPLSSLTGLAFVLGPGSPAINRWAILYRPAGLDSTRRVDYHPAGVAAIGYRPAGLDFAPVLSRRPVRPTGAIDTSPPFRTCLAWTRPVLGGTGKLVCPWGLD